MTVLIEESDMTRVTQSHTSRITKTLLENTDNFFNDTNGSRFQRLFSLLS
jgi:hypothetical protein